MSEEIISQCNITGINKDIERDAEILNSKNSDVVEI